MISVQILRAMIAGLLLSSSCLDGNTPIHKNEFGEEISDWQVRLELARVLSYQKKYDESIQQYQVVLARHPHDDDLRLEYAQVLAYAGKNEEALHILKALPEAHSDDKRLLALANVYSAMKEFSPSEDLYRRYLEAHPDDLKIRFKYAEVLSWQKKYPEAVAQFEILLKEHPHDIQLRRKYALVLIWMGDTKKAQAELESTLPSETQKPEVQK